MGRLAALAEHQSGCAAGGFLPLLLLLLLLLLMLCQKPG
jgi:hypothetical protein